MKELVALIRLHCEAGTILEHMELFDELDAMVGAAKDDGTNG